MGIDVRLQSLLDQASDDDLIDVIFILKASVIGAKSGSADRPGRKLGRKIFARHGHEALTEIIDDAAKRSGQTVTELKTFDHVASARLRAPVRLVKLLAAHPSVASIGLTDDEYSGR